MSVRSKRLIESKFLEILKSVLVINFKILILVMCLLGYFLSMSSQSLILGLFTILMLADHD